ncbi:glutamate--cysteine ligase, partial [Cymbomonas tetramitiformis]
MSSLKCSTTRAVSDRNIHITSRSSVRPRTPLHSTQCIKTSTRACLQVKHSRAPRRISKRNVTTASSVVPSDVVLSNTEPQIDFDDLVAFLASGSKPREEWRIGTEHEKFGFYLEDLRPMDYTAVKALLEGLVNRFKWEPMMEGEYIIGVKQNGQSVTLEPGGQFELS